MESCALYISNCINDQIYLIEIRISLRPGMDQKIGYMMSSNGLQHKRTIAFICVKHQLNFTERLQMKILGIICPTTTNIL